MNTITQVTQGVFAHVLIRGARSNDPPVARYETVLRRREGGWRRLVAQRPHANRGVDDFVTNITFHSVRRFFFCPRASERHVFEIIELGARCYHLCGKNVFG